MKAIAKEGVMKSFGRFATFAALVSVLAASGCAMVAPRGGGPAPTQQSGIEGRWIDQGGIAVSTFRDGQFVSVDARTGGTMSQGTYQFQDRNNIHISMTALARGTQVEVACTMPNPNQLNCTNSMGTNFVLTRRS
ncbi:hypothetical protein [Chelativorans sp. M5D2P16]|uniref:hypothetical protein n=1 Tax=Chelativorans sp. M5D2P16 TaxID=3095678 RepID=UPI002ACA707B|nr:hypothetical protein [Chelativorans sp. M5D2P16]MDZ5697526.1 hypothetical protein [Chelativorans sp. M5D2P16]